LAVYQRKRGDLAATIHTTLHPIFYSQLKNLGKLTLSRFKKTQLTEPVEVSLSKPGSDTWDRVLAAFMGLLGKAEEEYITKTTRKYIFLL